jgi:hypothetical protein
MDHVCWLFFAPKIIINAYVSASALRVISLTFSTENFLRQSGLEQKGAIKGHDAQSS